jgi:micrococcal nuclease
LQSEPTTTTATVLKVVDGDTVDVDDDRRGRLRVRVLGIDTPETKKPHFAVACGGPEATAFATATLVGLRVAIVVDASQNLHDRYGRTLAYLVKSNGWNYSVEAARAGVARAYIYDRRPDLWHESIVSAELEARVARRGIWGPPCNGVTESVPR